MKIACAYIRVSDERQDEFSPDSQLKLIEKFCLEKGYFLPQDYIFFDDGISAKGSAKRTAFLSMIELARSETHPVDAVIVWKYSRFARNQEDSILYKSILRRAGVEVMSVSEPLSDDPFGSLIERIIEWMDEYYVVRLSGEVKRGMTEKALRGQHNGPPPMGYYIKEGKLFPHEKESAVIKKIFSLFLSGRTVGEVAESLNRLGLCTRKGARFDRRNVTYILRNPIYAGYTRWSAEGRMASKRQFDSDRFILAKGEHEPLVPEQVFQEAGRRLGALSRDYLLRGMLFCGDCGAKMVRSGGKKPFFQCGRYAGGKGCFSHCGAIGRVEAEAARLLEDAGFSEACSLLRDEKLTAGEKNQELALLGVRFLCVGKAWRMEMSEKLGHRR